MKRFEFYIVGLSICVSACGQMSGFAVENASEESSFTDATHDQKGVVRIGSGLTVTAGTVSLNFGMGAGSAMEASAVPNCLAGQKLQMSLGPTYSWSCTTETDPSVSAFAKTAPPNCSSGQVLSSDGTTLSCVATSAVDTSKVAKAGDTMTGLLTLPTDGLVVGTSQLVITGNKIGIGTTPTGHFHVDGGTASAGENGAKLILKAQDGGSGGTTVGGDVEISGGIGPYSGGNIRLTAGGDYAGHGTINLDGGIRAIFFDFDAYAPMSTSSSVPALDGFSIENLINIDGGGVGMTFVSQNSVGTRQRAYLGVISNASGDSPDIVIGRQSGADAYDESLRIDASGDVGIGVLAPTTKLQVNGVISPATDNAFSLGSPTLRFTALHAVNGTIQTSDRRLKTNIEESDLGLDFIERLRPVSYRWKSGDRERHYGLIAQETEDAVRASVKSPANERQSAPIVYRDEVSDRMGLRYSELISPIIKAVQELARHVRASDLRTDNLERENHDLKDRVLLAESQLVAMRTYLCARDPNATLCSK